jgi:ABC-type bacteriocin/lantibiotic exporter with double-glycine peptidase domain
MSKLTSLPKLSFYDSIFLLTSSIITTLLGLVLPFSILIIFDRVLPNQATSTLYFIFSIILLAIFLDYKISRLEEVLIAKLGNKFEEKITNQLFESICHVNLSLFKKLEVGEYLERLNTIPSLKSYFSGDIISSAINMFTCFITLLVLTIINFNTGIIILGASTFLFVVAFISSSKKVELLKNKSIIEGVTNSKIIEIVSYPLDIKSRSMEYRIENLMLKMINKREEHSTFFEKQESDFSLLLAFIQQLSIALVVTNCALSIIDIELSQGAMAAIILLTNRYFGPYQQALSTIGRWKINIINIERLNEVLSMKEVEESIEENIVSFDGSHVEKSLDSVLPVETKQETTTKVSTLPIITYKNHEICFPTGHISIISGKSGSGKSELLDTIQQCSDDQGRHYINHVVKVDMNSSFIEGSIIDNITCFQPRLYKAAYSLCEALGVKSKIDELKLGFFTELTNTADNVFSRQIGFALMIVRSLLSNKNIIIIDDLDLVYDQNFANKILSCLRPRTNTYTFVLVSNKIKDNDVMISKVNLGL